MSSIRSVKIEDDRYHSNGLQSTKGLYVILIMKIHLQMSYLIPKQFNVSIVAPDSKEIVKVIVHIVRLAQCSLSISDLTRSSPNTSTNHSQITLSGF